MKLTTVLRKEGKKFHKAIERTIRRDGLNQPLQENERRQLARQRDKRTRLGRG